MINCKSKLCFVRKYIFLRHNQLYAILVDWYFML